MSLIYVGYQIRLSNQIAKAEAIREVTNTYDLHLSHLQLPKLGQITRRGLGEFNALSADEQSVFNGYHYPLLNQIETVFEMRDLKLIPEHQYDAWMSVGVSLICTPGGREWWIHAQKTLSPVFADALNKLLHDDNYAKVPFTDLWPWLAEE